MSANKTWHILVANGPNLDLLGSREPDIYGFDSLAAIEQLLRSELKRLAKLFHLPEPTLTFMQSNHEGVFLDALSQTWDGALINAGAWTHTSLALADRLAALGRPFIEVHLSNLTKREPIRHQSYLAPLASGVVFGLGKHSYTTGLYGLMQIFTSTSS